MSIDTHGRAHRPAGSPASTGGQFAAQTAPASAALLEHDVDESIYESESFEHARQRATELLNQHELPYAIWLPGDVEDRYRDIVGHEPTEATTAAIYGSDAVQVHLGSNTHGDGTDYAVTDSIKRACREAGIDLVSAQRDIGADGEGRHRPIEEIETPADAAYAAKRILDRGGLAHVIWTPHDFHQVADELGVPDADREQIVAIAMADARSTLSSSGVEYGWDQIDDAIHEHRQEHA